MFFGHQLLQKRRLHMRIIDRRFRRPEREMRQPGTSFNRNLEPLTRDGNWRDPKRIWDVQIYAVLDTVCNTSYN